jgi:UDP-3-O-[3-hydroxymyristoyl] glucosamine N-acyltransferase
MAAFAGVSGSCVIEDDVMFGGRVGLQDHITIGKGARIGGNSALAESVPAGETWMGDPAQPLRQYLRQVSEVRRLARRDTRTPKKKD